MCEPNCISVNTICVGELQPATIQQSTSERVSAHFRIQIRWQRVVWCDPGEESANRPETSSTSRVPIAASCHNGKINCMAFFFLFQLMVDFQWQRIRVFI